MSNVAITDEELHRAKCHPDYDYATSRSGRKSSDVIRPEGEGWTPNECIPNHDYKDGAIVLECWRAWDRFDFYDEEYWKRRRLR